MLHTIQSCELDTVGSPADGVISFFLFKIVVTPLAECKLPTSSSKREVARCVPDTKA